MGIKYGSIISVRMEDILTWKEAEANKMDLKNRTMSLDLTYMWLAIGENRVVIFWKDLFGHSSVLNSWGSKNEKKNCGAQSSESTSIDSPGRVFSGYALITCGV